MLPEYGCEVCLRQLVTPNGKVSGQPAVDIPKLFLLRQKSRMRQTLEARDIGYGLPRLQGC